MSTDTARTIIRRALPAPNGTKSLKTFPLLNLPPELVLEVVDRVSHFKISCYDDPGQREPLRGIKLKGFMPYLTTLQSLSLTNKIMRTFCVPALFSRSFIWLDEMPEDQEAQIFADMPRTLLTRLKSMTFISVRSVESKRHCANLLQLLQVPRMLEQMTLRMLDYSTPHIFATPIVLHGLVVSSLRKLTLGNRIAELSTCFPNVRHLTYDHTDFQDQATLVDLKLAAQDAGGLTKLDHLTIDTHDGGDGWEYNDSERRDHTISVASDLFQYIATQVPQIRSLRLGVKAAQLAFLERVSELASSLHKMTNLRELEISPIHPEHFGLDGDLIRRNDPDHYDDDSRGRLNTWRLEVEKRFKAIFAASLSLERIKSGVLEVRAQRTPEISGFIGWCEWKTFGLNRYYGFEGEVLSLGLTANGSPRFLPPQDT